MRTREEARLPGFTGDSSLDPHTGQYGIFIHADADGFTTSAQRPQIVAALMPGFRCFMMCEDWRNGVGVGDCSLICVPSPIA